MVVGVVLGELTGERPEYEEYDDRVETAEGRALLTGNEEGSYSGIGLPRVKGERAYIPRVRTGGGRGTNAQQCLWDQHTC